MKNKEENGTPEPNNAEVLTKKFWISPATHWCTRTAMCITPYLYLRGEKTEESNMATYDLEKKKTMYQKNALNLVINKQQGDKSCNK